MFKFPILILCLLAILVTSKPIYDFKKSYVTQLTPINFKDQVTKIRQNTNYVSIVHFYKESGINAYIQMVSLKAELLSSTSGSTSTTVFSGLELLIARSFPSCALINQFQCFRRIRCILLFPSHLQQSQYPSQHTDRLLNLKSTKTRLQISPLQRNLDNKFKHPNLHKLEPKRSQSLTLHRQTQRSPHDLQRTQCGFLEKT